MTRYTTVIEEFVGGQWKYFDQQCVSDGERELTDQEYLESCQRCYEQACKRLNWPIHPLRIRPFRSAA